MMVRARHLALYGSGLTAGSTSIDNYTGYFEGGSRYVFPGARHVIPRVAGTSGDSYAVVETGRHPGGRATTSGGDGNCTSRRGLAPCSGIRALGGHCAAAGCRWLGCRWCGDCGGRGAGVVRRDAWPLAPPQGLSEGVVVPAEVRDRPVSVGAVAPHRR